MDPVGVPFSLVMQRFSADANLIDPDTWLFFPFSPHLCVVFLFLDLYLPPPPLPSAASLSHTMCKLVTTPSFTHTQLVTYKLGHTPHNFVTPSFTHHLSHTQLITHNLSHTQLCNTIFHTHTTCHTHTTLSQTSHTHTHTPLSHTQLCHTIFHTHTHRACHTQLCHTSHTTLSHLRFAWQAWHLCHLAGSGGALGSAWSPGTPLHFCVAGVALMTLGWVWWRAWVRLVARGAAALLRGRRGTWRHGPAFCVAGVALGDIDLRFAWKARHL